MKIETFCQRLREGKSVNYVYEAEGNTGLVATWRHENVFVLTWEECADGDVYNEQSYTRDEVHHFQTVDAVLRFLEANALDATQFKP